MSIEEFEEELYNLFVEETQDDDGEVDNNYYPIWLKERLNEVNK